MVKKIAILGGGPSSLATAFHLTNLPNWKEKYEITIYTMGWRLGGKTASSRDFEAADRIQEHGIHIFGNYYCNIFNIVKACYEEIQFECCPCKDLKELFFPNNLGVNMDPAGKDNLLISPFMAPHNDSIPWHRPLDWEANPSEIVLTLFNGIVGMFFEGWNALSHPPRFKAVKFLFEFFENEVKEFYTSISERVKFIMHKHSEKEPMPPGHLLHLGSHLAKMGEPEHESLLSLIEKFLKWLAHYADNVVDSLVNEVRTIRILMEVYMAILRGVISDKLYKVNEVDSDCIDHLDQREWLMKHGLDESIINSGMANIAPYVCFQFPNNGRGVANDGSVPGPNPVMSATSFLLFTMRPFFAKGAFMYRFLAGTGEIVITPIYLTLLKRGVHFKFFHKVEQLHLNADRTGLASVDFQIQATLKPGIERYEPLVDFFLEENKKQLKPPLRVWLAHPDYNQLVEGEELKQKNIDLESYWADWNGVGKLTITQGVDFDECVLAIPVSCHPYICKEIVPDNKKWQKMIEHLPGSQTYAYQMWATKSSKELGWPIVASSPSFAIGIAAEKLAVYSDFSDLINVERWNRTGCEVPKLCLYVGGPFVAEIPQPPFTDHNYPERHLQSAKHFCLDFTKNVISKMYPEFVMNDFATYKKLDSSNNKNTSEDLARFNQQFFRINMDPNELYICSPKGSASFRLHAWESGYQHLTFAGDWIYTGMNCGAIEAAAIGGAVASYTLTGQPLLKDIPGYLFMHVNQDSLGDNIPHPCV